MDVSPMYHKVSYEPQTVVEGEGRFAKCLISHGRIRVHAMRT